MGHIKLSDWCVTIDIVDRTKNNTTQFIRYVLPRRQKNLSSAVMPGSKSRKCSFISCQPSRSLLYWLGLCIPVNIISLIISETDISQENTHPFSPLSASNYLTIMCCVHMQTDSTAKCQCKWQSAVFRRSAKMSQLDVRSVLRFGECIVSTRTWSLLRIYSSHEFLLFRHCYAQWQRNLWGFFPWELGVFCSCALFKLRLFCAHIWLK